MIIEGILGVAAFSFCFYLVLRLIDKAQLRKLRTKYPEGTETVARPVENMRINERNKMESKILSTKPLENLDTNKIFKDLSNGKSEDN